MALPAVLKTGLGMIGGPRKVRNDYIEIIFYILYIEAVVLLFSNRI
jgi:hypothetical protein